MIHTAIITLSDNGGSSRQALWKFIENQFPEANYKLFLTRLKSYSNSDTGFILKSKTGAKFRLSRGFRDGLAKRVARGMSIAQAVDQLVRKVPLGPAKKKKALKPSALKKRKAAVKKVNKAKKAKEPKKS